jgi:hypothetical protein
MDRAGRDPVLRLGWAYICLGHDSFARYNNKIKDLVSYKVGDEFDGLFILLPFKIIIYLWFHWFGYLCYDIILFCKKPSFQKM